MKLGIVGSRSLENNKECKKLMEQIVHAIDKVYDIGEIISGGAIGPDTWANEIANNMYICSTIIRPKKWYKEDIRKRNEDIAESCDILLAFVDVNSKTHGTSMTIGYARKHQKKVFIYEFRK